MIKRVKRVQSGVKARVKKSRVKRVRSKGYRVGGAVSFFFQRGKEGMEYAVFSFQSSVFSFQSSVSDVSC